MLNHTLDNTPVHGMEEVLEINLYSIAFVEESMKNVDALCMHLALFFFTVGKRQVSKKYF